MKKSVRIIAGNMKGKVIPFDNSRFDNADITPQKVKGAVFSIVGEELYGKVFVDLFSGSGQIGLEALSRYSSRVVFCEINKQRYGFIKKTVHEAGRSEDSVILNSDYSDALKYLVSIGVKADILFADPPYITVQAENFRNTDIISEVAESGILKDDSIFVFQHSSYITLPENISGLKMSVLKKYGTTSISLYIFE